MVQAENVMTKVDVIHTALQTQLCANVTLSDTVNELIKRNSDIEKHTDIHDLNQLNDKTSEALPREEPIVILMTFKLYGM